MLLDAAINTSAIAPFAIGFLVLCFIVAFAIAGSSGFMGLRLKQFKDPVDGTLRVVSASMPPYNAASSNYSLTGVIQAPGVPATSVTHSGLASTSKWPQPGDELPVTLERGEPTKFLIRWDEIDSTAKQATRLADQLAQSMNSAGSVTVPAAAATTANGDVELLEQLSRLHDSGALSDGEFAAQKARILGAGS